MTRYCIALAVLSLLTIFSYAQPSLPSSFQAKTVHSLGQTSGKETDAILATEVSRFSRCRSARISEACWYRRFRSFSRPLLMIRSSSADRSGFSRTANVGAVSRMALKITPELSPRNGNVPVAISYRTAPNENKSVLPSNSFARTCSGDM